MDVVIGYSSMTAPADGDPKPHVAATGHHAPAAGTSMEDAMDTRTRTWGGYTLENRIEFGSAAHRNRGRHSGVKIHRLMTEYVIAVDPSVEEVRPGSFGAIFLKTGKPVLFACHPVCGTTGGQHAGKPVAGLTAGHVTCTKCFPNKVAR